MVSNSKILTVSYGTFSCTLEGFDQPFNTMTSIAEYFRDLAADDRYFGAEPPTPDADMLHRIAEREIQKRVEARVENNGVVLRQADAEQSTQTAVGATLVAADHLLSTDQDAPEQQDTSEDVAAANTALAASEDEAVEGAEGQQEPQIAAETPQEDVKDASDSPAAPNRDSIADKLQRIRAVVDEKRAEGEAAFVATDQYAEDQNPSDLFEDGEDLNDIEAEIEADDVSQAPLEGQDAPDDVTVELSENAPQEDEATAEPIVDDVAEEDGELAPVDDAPDAPTLGVHPRKSDDAPFVYSAAEDIVEAEDVVADESAESLAESQVEPSTEDLAEVTEDLTEEQSDEGEDALTNGDGEDTISGILSRLQSSTPTHQVEGFEEDLPAVTEDHFEDEIVDDLSGGAADDLTTDPSALATLVSTTLGDDRPVAATDNIFSDDIDTAEKGDGNTAEEDAQDAEPEATEPTSLLRKPRMIRVRHIKGARPDAVTADAEETSDREIVEPASQDNENSMLTPEDEAELMAELAEAEAQARTDLDESGEDIAADDKAIEAEVDLVVSEQSDDDTDENAPRLTAFDDSGVGKSDAALDRILAETNTQMDSTEVTRRRTAIAHLKAAVMATRADKEAEDGLISGEDGDDANAYRDDLARVVRPRRPGKSDTPARRMPPLVLVSEQRIDDTPTNAEPATPTGEAVRPRRVVRSPQIALEMDEEGQTKHAPEDPIFAAYVEDTGASDVGELLEAAACHTVLVEGQDTFTRPRVMGMVRMYQGFDAFSREEGLRAFGKLLREGRIKRLKRGQFELTDSTRFRPGERSGDRPDDRRMA